MPSRFVIVKMRYKSPMPLLVVSVETERSAIAIELFSTSVQSSLRCPLRTM